MTNKERDKPAAPQGGAYAELPSAKTMAQRLMGWKLPADFAPDCYVSFDRERATASGNWPIGTNLFTVAQAEAMFAHVLKQDPVAAIAGAFQTSHAHASELKQAFAEVAHAVQTADSANYAPLPTPNLPRGGFPDLFTADQMNAHAHADATHALRVASHGQAPAAERPYISPVKTVADLVNNLLLMDQTLPVYGAQYIEHEGRRRAIAVDPTVSRERVKGERWIGEGDELNAAVIWTRAEQPAQAAPAATPQADSQPAPGLDMAVMQLAESVGLIGPASRVHDLHAAIQRFHDLICVNATIKAAVMAADAIRGAATSVRDYPPLPMQFACSGVFPVYSADQMRAYVDADRAARAPADSVTAAAATVIKKGADRQWMSERLGHLPDGIYSLYLAPPAQAADSVLEDAALLDWLALAGPTSICVVSDRPRDGEVEVATDDVTGYGKTLREALAAARKQGANHD